MTSAESFHTKRHSVTTPFNPVANHTLATISVTLVNPPAVIAPKNSARNAPTRRFRFAFFLIPSHSLGSTSKSHSSVVSTTVGISSYASTRDATIWPAAWKARSEIGRTCSH